MIYFVRDDVTAAIKIGFSSNPRRRFTDLQIGSSSPLSLLVVIDGDEADERRLHGVFARLRSRGEWFVDDGSIAAFIASAEPSAAHAEARRPRNPNALCPSNLSRHLGISQPFASQVLSGKRNLSLEYLARSWSERGWKIGILASASDADCDAFVRIVCGSASAQVAA